VSILEKKAELSITVIVVTVIALVVLAVIVFLVLRSSKNYSSATACLEQGGVCKSYYADCVTVEVPNTQTPCGGTKKCCEPIS